MQNQKKKRIIIDCDPGVDDALAIVFALKSKSLIVDSITTVNGNVPVEQTTLNALKILEFMGRKDIPVAMGADKPLKVERVHSRYVFGEDGLGNFSYSLPHSNTAIEIDAVDHILKRIKDGNIDAIVAIGPLTNIALAYKKNKALMNSVKQLVIMGGAINVKGNITELAEFNFYCDPHAADYVLSKATNIKLIPLDVTTKAQFYKSDIVELKDSKEKIMIQKVTKTWYKFCKDVKQEGIALHDPLTVGFVISQEFLHLTNAIIKIGLTELNWGACTIVNDTAPIKNSNNIIFAVKLGEIDFMKFFCNTISSDIE